MKSSTTIFVDLQGFKNFKNEFIVKELAIVSKEWTQVFLVKPPYPFTTLSSEEKKQTRWLERNKGIFWSEGFIDHREFKRIINLYLENKNIVVKGFEKVRWLNEVSQNCKIVELGDKGCPNLFTLHNKYKECDLNCVNHKKQCALKNAMCLKKWYFDNNMWQFKLFS